MKEQKQINATSTAVLGPYIWFQQRRRGVAGSILNLFQHKVESAVRFAQSVSMSVCITMLGNKGWC